MAEADANCSNCGAALHGRFCARCGQEALPLDPPLRDVLRDAVHELLDVDGRIFRTGRRLFLSPGYLTREYFEGRRIAWVPPLRLYLLFNLAYFAVATLSDVKVSVTGAQTDAETATALQELGFGSEREMRAAIAAAQRTWMPRVMFLLVPLFAWLVHMVRRGSGRAYPQHLIFAMHAHAAWFGARALASAVQMAAPAILGSIAEALSVVYGVAYVTAAMRTAYGVTAGRAVRDSAIVLGAYWVAVLLATLGIVLPVIFWRR